MGRVIFFPVRRKMLRNAKYNTPYVNMKAKLKPGHRYCETCNGTCIYKEDLCPSCKNGQVPIIDSRSRTDVLYSLTEYLASSCGKTIDAPDLIRKEISTVISPEDFLRVIENYDLYSPKERTDICDLSYRFVAKAIVSSVFESFA